VRFIGLRAEHRAEIEQAGLTCGVGRAYDHRRCLAELRWGGPTADSSAWVRTGGTGLNAGSQDSQLARSASVPARHWLDRLYVVGRPSLVVEVLWSRVVRGFRL
jgi:hypothetical protein